MGSPLAFVTALPPVSSGARFLAGTCPGAYPSPGVFFAGTCFGPAPWPGASSVSSASSSLSPANWPHRESSSSISSASWIRGIVSGRGRSFDPILSFITAGSGSDAGSDARCRRLSPGTSVSTSCFPRDFRTVSLPLAKSTDQTGVPGSCTTISGSSTGRPGPRYFGSISFA